MKCKCCGAEIVRIKTMGLTVACDAAPVTYWPIRDGAEQTEIQQIYTPNGETPYGMLTGELQDAVGVGYIPHTCNLLTLIFKGRDSWSRPVYECPTSGRLYVDVEPRADREPKICTKYMNAFDGEPDCHVKPEISFDFIPHRDTWD